jgi:arsenate reductase-like glutaredoxin family protein
MSLNQQYTWHDFLKEHPEHKELKRTSSEGKKAFESAFKTHTKKHLDGRIASYEKNTETAKKRRAELVAKSKEANKAEKKIRVKQLNAEIGRIDAAAARYGRQIESAKAAHKHVK